MFDRHRRARLFTLPIPPIILALLVLLPYANTTRGWLPELADLTHGVVTPVLVTSLVALGVMLVVVFGAGKVRPDDLGLDRDGLARGVGITLMIWAATQVAGVLPRVVAEDPVAIHRSWLHGSWSLNVGHFLGALGFATVIEVALRGFLLVQLYLLFHREPKNPYQGLAWATIVTVILGNVVMLPVMLPTESSRTLVLQQAIVAGVGLYMSWIYVRTRNLFFTIGVLTLILAPTPVVAGLRGEPSWFFPAVVAFVAGIWVLLWPRRE